MACLLSLFVSVNNNRASLYIGHKFANNGWGKKRVLCRRAPRSLFLFPLLCLSLLRKKESKGGANVRLAPPFFLGGGGGGKEKRKSVNVAGDDDGEDDDDDDSCVGIHR